METTSFKRLRRPLNAAFIPISSSSTIFSGRASAFRGAYLEPKRNCFTQTVSNQNNRYILSRNYLQSNVIPPSLTYNKPDDADNDKHEENMNVYKKNSNKKRRCNDELLPFDVSISSPPPEYLGRFMLDPTTHNGDIVEYDGRQFVVKRVRMRYRYQQGAFRMVGKTLEVNSLARKALESYLERTYNDS